MMIKDLFNQVWHALYMGLPSITARTDLARILHNNQGMLPHAQHYVDVHPKWCSWLLTFRLALKTCWTATQTVQTTGCPHPALAARTAVLIRHPLKRGWSTRVLNLCWNAWGEDPSRSVDLRSERRQWTDTWIDWREAGWGVRACRLEVWMKSHESEVAIM